MWNWSWVVVFVCLILLLKCSFHIFSYCFLKMGSLVCEFNLSDLVCFTARVEIGLGCEKRPVEWLWSNFSSAGCWRIWKAGTNAETTSRGTGTSSLLLTMFLSTFCFCFFFRWIQFAHFSLLTMGFGWGLDGDEVNYISKCVVCILQLNIFFDVCSWKSGSMKEFFVVVLWYAWLLPR